MKAIWTSVVIAAVAVTGVSLDADAKSKMRHSAKATKAAVKAGIADPARADQASDDARRKPAAVIAFAGVGPGDKVIDFFPGSGYWTRIFTGVVGPTGRVYALWPMGTEQYAEKPLPALKARNLANVTAELQTTPIPTAAEPVDVFWTVQNYHDIPNDGRGEVAINGFNRAVLAGLKPGGTYLIIDHADAAGSGMTGTSTKHRIDPAVVKVQVTAAGFTFEGSSKALADKTDDHSKSVFDPAIRGKTDQFVMKFRKPG